MYEPYYENWKVDGGILKMYLTHGLSGKLYLGFALGMKPYFRWWLYLPLHYLS